MRNANLKITAPADFPDFVHVGFDHDDYGDGRFDIIVDGREIPAFLVDLELGVVGAYAMAPNGRLEIRLGRRVPYAIQAQREITVISKRLPKGSRLGVPLLGFPISV